MDTLSAAVPAALVAVRTLGRTLKQWAADVLAHFDRPGTKQRLDRSDQRTLRTRGSAFGFRDLTNYVARSLLLEAGGFRPGPHRQS